MARGRPPKPTRQKLLEGNRGKRKLRPDDVEPDPLTSVPPPPATLTGDMAIAEWTHKAALLVALKVLTEMDLQSLAIYCQSCQDYWDAVAFLRENGTTQDIYDAEGSPRCVQQRPEVSIARQAAKQIKELGGLFGFTPSDRARLKLVPPAEGEADQLGNFASKKQSTCAGKKNNGR